MAAEIGTMRVTEQIDALEIMAIDPYRFLNLPRIVGTFISLPILTVMAEFVALVCGAAYAHFFLNIPIAVFNYGLIHFFYMKDFFGGLANGSRVASTCITKAIQLPSGDHAIEEGASVRLVNNAVCPVSIQRNPRTRNGRSLSKSLIDLSTAWMGWGI